MAPSADDIIDGYKQLIARAHVHGMRIIVATLTPFEDAFKGTRKLAPKCLLFSRRSGQYPISRTHLAMNSLLSRERSTPTASPASTEDRTARGKNENNQAADDPFFVRFFLGYELSRSAGTGACGVLEQGEKGIRIIRNPEGVFLTKPRKVKTLRQSADWYSYLARLDSRREKSYLSRPAKAGKPETGYDVRSLD